MRKKKDHKNEEKEQGDAPESAELLLAGGVPDVEPDGAAVGVEDQGVNLPDNVKRGHTDVKVVHDSQ